MEKSRFSGEATVASSRVRVERIGESATVADKIGRSVTFMREDLARVKPSMS
jgi:hypothetical protein